MLPSYIFHTFYKKQTSNHEKIETILNKNIFINLMYNWHLFKISCYLDTTLALPHSNTAMLSYSHDNTVRKNYYRKISNCSRGFN